MYRQVNVFEAHRGFQQILWRENSDSHIKTYKLITIIYGTVPASYLTTACLKELTESDHTSEPNVTTTVIRDFYMNDFQLSRPR